MGKNRLYNWSEDSIRWYSDAEPYDRFHAQVADIVLSSLPEKPNVCDVGSGIGALSLPLASGCRRVTACDVLQRPLDVVCARAAERNINNIITLCGDFMALPVPEEKYDALVFCRFGRIQDFVERAFEWTDGKVFFVQNNSHRHSFTTDGKDDKSVNCAVGQRFLDGLGVHYTVRVISSEMGQPFTSRADAEKFLAYYDGESSPAARAEYLDERLRENGDERFPLYLPSEKHFTVFEIDAPLK